MRIANRLLLSGNEAVARAARAASVVFGTDCEAVRGFGMPSCPARPRMLDFDIQRRHPVAHSSSFMPKCQRFERSGFLRTPSELAA